MNSDQVYQTVQRIASVSSRKEKAALTAKLPKRYLEWTYHPHWRFCFTNKGPLVMMKGRGKNLIDPVGWTMLQVLRDRPSLNKKMISLVGRYIKTLTPKSAELYKKIILKDLKCGIAQKTVLDLYPGLFPDEFVMKGIDYDERHLHFPAWVSPKLDGLRCYYRDGELYTSSGRLHRGLDHIITELRSRNVTRDKDGEVAVPYVDFDTSSGMIRANKATPRARYYAFDDPSVGGVWFEDRLYNMDVMCRDMVFVKLVQHIRIVRKEEMYRYFDNCMAKGVIDGVPLDGIMVKDARHTYQYTRSPAWMKLKLHDTKDVRVLDVLEGTGKYEGMVGALLCEGDIKVGIGLSDKQRQDWWEHPSTIIDGMIEVGFMQKSSKDKLRHPKLMRLRPDKE